MINMQELDSGVDQQADIQHVLQAVLELANRQLLREKQEPVAAYQDPDAMSSALDLSIGAEGTSAIEVLRLLDEIVSCTPRTSTTRFFNQLFSGRDSLATAAEMLTALLNTSMYTFKIAGPHALIEIALLERLVEKVGYNDGEGIFAPGGSMSNLGAMIIARDQLRPEIREDGPTGERLIAYASEECHYSIPKAASFLGLGRANLRNVPVDDRGRMRADALSDLIDADVKAGHTPLIVVATCGTTVQGAFDPVDQLADVARRAGVWLHVDAAYGGSVLFSRKHRDLVAGLERADSVAWNPHKMLGVPLSCSSLLTRRKGVIAESFKQDATYLFQTEDEQYNLGMRSMQCGRRNDALKLWAAWKHHGDAGFERRIDHLFDMARYASDRIVAEPGLELVVAPESVNVCFEAPGRSSEAICEMLRREGRILVGYAFVNGKTVLRVPFVNGALTKADVDHLLDEIIDVSRRSPELITTVHLDPSANGCG